MPIMTQTLTCLLLAYFLLLLKHSFYCFRMMWAAGAVAAMSSITFPAISAIVSRNADPDQQGVVQGMVTGIRGLCNGLGPALYGFVFYLFHVELNEMTDVEPSDKVLKPNMANPSDEGYIDFQHLLLHGTAIPTLCLGSSTA
ncbi:hypothetical protein AB205_0102180 [Aquarana catesbeiana]|uniref:Major facilitator superfamily (MFS) profile domain-containing protein n=1 Tax=Aquarana catesbeiana TaxID=8400 RepID=A0A2G9S3H5_AQUCT|nr:hypothetical protein AB205_0102180 [Aquarana catesbeiana]